MKPNILLINTEFPVPTDNGGKLALMGFLEALCEISNLTLLTFDEGNLEAHKRELQYTLPTIHSIHIVPHKIHIRGDLKAIFSVARLMFLHNLPYFTAKFVSKQFSATLEMLLNKKEFKHIVICHDTRMGSYLPLLRKLAPRSSIEALVIDIEKNVLSDFVKQRPLAPVNQLARIEKNRCARFEKHMRNNVDHLFCVSVSDMEQIKRERPKRSVSYLPPSIKPDHKHCAVMSTPPPEIMTVLMVSDFNWQPNTQAARWFLNKVVPRLWRMKNDARILLVGKGSAELASKMGNERIMGLGFVDNLDKLYQEATAVAVPVLATSGIRIKLLDAMISAVPIVSTDTAAGAIGAVDGKHLMASNDPQMFAEKIVRISVNPALGAKLRESAFAFVQENHSIPKIRSEFVKYFKALENSNEARSTAAGTQTGCA